MRIQPWHILVLVVVVLLVFGASRLPDIARNVGKSMKIMKEEVKDLREDDEPKPAEDGEPPAPPQVAPPTTSTSTSTPAPPPAANTDAPGVPSPTTQFDQRSSDRTA